MNKGKRLLILLLTVLTMVVAYTMMSFADSANSQDTYAGDVGRATLSAQSVIYDGKEHGATLDDNITGNKHEGDDAYGVVKDVVYYKSDENGTTGAECGIPTDAGYYLAKALITIHTYDGTDYVTSTETLSVLYEIRKKQITVSWIPNKIYYNGTQQVPVAKAVDDDNKSVEITVVPETGDDGINAGDHQAVIKFKDSDLENNCVINGTQIPYPYEILPLPAQIAWYRPIYDNKTGEVTGDLQEVTADTVGMVYNATAQTPTAKVKNIVGDDEVKIRVSVESTQAVDVGMYLATAHVTGGKDVANYDFKNTVTSKDFEILPRPAALEWGYNPGNGADDVWTNSRGQSFGGLVQTTYNGILQEPVVRITNAPTAASAEKDPVEVNDIECTYAERTSTDASVIEEDRMFIDAGHYFLKVGDLSNKQNYTYYVLEQDNGSVDEGATGAISVSKNEKVDNVEAKYYIHRYEIEEINWANDSLTYNASKQLPTAEIADLQGPDTTADVYPVVSGDPEESVPGHCNVGNDYAAYICDIEGDLARNYKLDDPSDYVHPYEITKAKLVVTANPKTIMYGDAPANADVSYSGLQNGDTNTDRVNDKPGTYMYPEDDGEMINVVSGELKYSYNYNKNDKPGAYTISVSGLEANNYDITYRTGTLTVVDKVSTLVAQGTKRGSKAVMISWNSVNGAASYDVYASQCNSKGKKRAPKYVATVGSNSYKLKKLNGKKLKKNTCYKYYVVAKNGAGAPIATSLEGHCITGNVKGKTVNAKSMTVNTASVSVGKGGTAKLSASYKKAKKGKKFKLNNNAHSPLTRFVSENPAVATVDANGIVTGTGTGWCRVYVQGVSGMWQVVEVNVK